MFGGEYYYDTISVDPWTFEPMRSGLKLTPLRAYAHQVPRYYIQNFGQADSHPDTNVYAVFLQDTVRLTGSDTSNSRCNVVFKPISMLS